MGVKSCGDGSGDGSGDGDGDGDGGVSEIVFKEFHLSVHSYTLLCV